MPADKTIFSLIEEKTASVVKFLSLIP